MKRFSFSTTFRMAVMAMLVGCASVSFADGPGPSIDIFDVPNATVTYPAGINSGGQITGYYQDATGKHSFVRDRKGSIVTFDVPGSTETTAEAINEAGRITGYSRGPYNPRDWLVADIDRGFVRDPNGTITLFDACITANVPSQRPGAGYTHPKTINAEEEISGLCYEVMGIDMYDYGFLRDRDGTTHRVGQPSWTRVTQPAAINPRGQITGAYYQAGTVRGFVLEREGTTMFDGPFGPGALNPTTYPYAINPAGQITGSYAPDWTVGRNGFLRHSDGTMVSFVPDGSFNTLPTAINPGGKITGYYENASFDGYHGFLRDTDGTIMVFDVPDFIYTRPTAISAGGGHVTGWCSNGGVVHGFVRSN